MRGDGVARSRGGRDDEHQGVPATTCSQPSVAGARHQTPPRPPRTRPPEHEDHDDDPGFRTSQSSRRPRDSRPAGRMRNEKGNGRAQGRVNAHPETQTTSPSPSLFFSLTFSLSFACHPANARGSGNGAKQPRDVGPAGERAEDERSRQRWSPRYDSGPPELGPSGDSAISLGPELATAERAPVPMWRHSASRGSSGAGLPEEPQRGRLTLPKNLSRRHHVVGRFLPGCRERNRPEPGILAPVRGGPNKPGTLASTPSTTSACIVRLTQRYSQGAP